jgi:hypothetical protein
MATVYGVTEDATGDLLRWSKTAGGVSAGTGETYRTNVPDPAYRRYQNGATQMHQWNGSSWDLVAMPDPPVIVTTATNYTIGLYEELVCGDATSASLTVTIPSASANKGRTITVKKMAPSQTNKKVTLSAADNIDGAGTLDITVQYDKAAIRSNGTTWVTV